MPNWIMNGISLVDNCTPLYVDGYHFCEQNVTIKIIIIIIIIINLFIYHAL